MSTNPPPEWMKPVHDEDATELVNRRLTPSRSLRNLFKRKSSTSLPERRKHDEEAHGTNPSTPIIPQRAEDWPLMASVALSRPSETGDYVDLDASAMLPSDTNKDIYRWAVVYENQRGLTLFSSPYYSRMGLLPFDPPPFTVPDPSVGGHFFVSKSHQPSLTLASFPLPDGNWRWVSKHWMIDMRDSQVQYDGFEYNWLFRKGKWSSEIGHLSAGAWVRRRKWVRLMVKPARRKQNTLGPPSRSTTPSSAPVSASWRNSMIPPSRPPSVLDTISDCPLINPSLIWEGDLQEDWLRSHDYLKTLTRDGRKLEVWKSWLGLSNLAAFRPKQWTEDEKLMPSEEVQATIEEIAAPPIAYVAPVIREHLDEILQTFIYPDSRAQFMKFLGKAGILSDVGSPADFISSDTTQSLNFWSYTN